MGKKDAATYAKLDSSLQANAANLYCNACNKPMPKSRGIKRKYSSENLKAAYDAVLSKQMSAYAASKLYKVPKTTLLEKVNFQTNLNVKSGTPPVLGLHIEEKIANWIKAMARVGFPLRTLDIKETVKQICINENIENPFKNNTPGKTWLMRFLLRHPELSLKSTEHHSRDRASVTEISLRAWYNKLENVLEDEGISDVLNDPRRIFNADEKAFYVSPKGRKYIGVKGQTTQKLDTGGGEKENFTVLISFNAMGQKPPQMLVYKSKRAPPSIQDSLPNGWVMAKSETGWMRSETFLEWLGHFHSYCVEQELLPPFPTQFCNYKKVKQAEIGTGISKRLKQNRERVILFIDGHASHLSLEASYFCENRGIILYCLYPNATHVQQPADVGVMAAIEIYWKGVLQLHKLESGGTLIKKEEYAKLANEAFDQVPTEAMKNAFRVCGLYPLNSDAVQYNKLMSYQREHVQNESLEQGTNMVKTQKFIINNLFVDEAKLSDFTLIEEELPPLQDGEYMCEALYLSVDPYMRAFDISTYLGKSMVGSSVGRVLESRHKDFKVGDLVVGYFGWQSHFIFHGDAVAPFLDIKPYVLPDFGGLSPSLALGVLGMPGNTAYFGFLELCNPKAGETVVVNAAAGAVGMHVGQIAKIKGCHVIGFAGSDDKVQWLKDDIGFDAAFNYKTVNIDEALKEAAPNGVDCYFDNVGGEMSSKILAHMNNFGRIAVCGSISAYNSSEPPLAPLVQGHMIYKNLRMEGFIVYRWRDRWMEGIEQNLRWIKEGKLKYKETITKGFKNMPDAFISMMKGSNFGKAIIEV